MSAYAKAAEEQGEVVRKIKEAIKADPAAHTKDELDAAVAKLKELKAKADDPMNALEDPVTKVSWHYTAACCTLSLSPRERAAHVGSPAAAAAVAAASAFALGPSVRCERGWLYSLHPSVGRGRAARVPWGPKTMIAIVRKRSHECAFQMSMHVCTCGLVFRVGCGLIACPARGPDVSAVPPRASTTWYEAWARNA